MTWFIASETVMADICRHRQPEYSPVYRRRGRRVTGAAI
jgi:hypothetical protein